MISSPRSLNVRLALALASEATVRSPFQTLMRRPRQSNSSGYARLATDRCPAYEPDDGPLTLSQIAAIREIAIPLLPTGATVSQQSLFRHEELASVPDTSSRDRERAFSAHQLKPRATRPL